MNCLGYYGDPDANARLYTADGWMLTGDYCTIDDEGYLTVAGRASDFIIRGGKNISAAQVEDEVSTHPSVALAAAVAMPDPVFGERVCVYVELRPGASEPDLDAIRAHLDDRGVGQGAVARARGRGRRDPAVVRRQGGQGRAPRRHRRAPRDRAGAGASRVRAGGIGMSAAPQVETAGGRIEGARVAAPDGTGLQRFLGIPYAAPPVGARRFAPPAPAAPWSGVRPATRFGPAAPQSAGCRLASALVLGDRRRRGLPDAQRLDARRSTAPVRCSSGSTAART